MTDPHCPDGDGLLTCPCCGSASEASTAFDGSIYEGHVVICTSGKCGCQSGTFPTKAMAKRAWNTRATLQPTHAAESVMLLSDFAKTEWVGGVRSLAAPPNPAPDAMREALEAALEYIKTYGHHSGSWCNDTRAYMLITQTVMPALSAPVPSSDGAGEVDFLLRRALKLNDQEKFALAATLAEDVGYDLTEESLPSATGAAEPVADEELRSALVNDLSCASYRGEDDEEPCAEGAACGCLTTVRALRKMIERSATPPVRGDREAIARTIFKSRMKGGDQTADVYFARRASHPHAIDDSTMAVDAAFRDADTILSLPVQPGADEREKALRDEIFCLREVVRGVRIFDHAGRFKDYDGEPWLRRVRNIGLDHDPVEFNREPPHSSSEGGR